MKLTKEITVNKYRVLADYKVKIKKSPFMAVLQLAYEQKQYKELNAKILHENLLYPLSINACENLLIRMASMGYFKLYDDQENEQHLYYFLTEFGINAIVTKSFYSEKNGVLEIWTTEKNEFTSEIVKIEELPYDGDNKTETKRIDSHLNSLIKPEEIIKLNTGSYTIDKIESQIKLLKQAEENITIDFNTNNYTIKLVDFISYEKEDKQNIIESILINEFPNNYLPKENILLKEFNNQDISLIRNIKIAAPIFRETYFNSITIPNIKVNPKDLNDAKKWFEALLKQRVNRYFLSDEEFNQFENDIANKFELFDKELTNTISREYLINSFGKEDFYKKTKLETIDYLNY
ncbi:hypothetical protein [Tenacibaculum finnmarkense]|uniref:Uncharacterized protein n=1 Tax=Tenacibaculum finnmarkense genomovar ulcerans TaxID=2781388 RepID=A0A2I2LFX6_9FLAO|nr:hypothetical protein [Tenacibaculum finnmarkense]MBE7697614.1 hypothetical protein [Tenacibaculum finnmarkense genomovar ulcerans]MCD8400227.1 hypothetical protein [Tenacibaculum finnmarkense genomovar ulcerans]MCD8432342.1 hypothetical protein [Tenacibaculum finnmarkense genomovar ulcerans]MCG8802992.1 hypothetical protein [Tenacibaculum finnmarkense]MCG8825720.1 hypothetical protein [Tenacibaculum finnmarkense]